MSYCRWSSNNWACDVYVYESVYDCWTIHVASRKRERLPTPELDIMAVSRKAWMKSHHRMMDELKTIPLVDIDLPHAGETFNEPTPDACADRLEALRALGYHVPQYAIDALREEAAEQARAKEAEHD